MFLFSDLNNFETKNFFWTRGRFVLQFQTSTSPFKSFATPSDPVTSQQCFFFFKTHIYLEHQQIRDSKDDYLELILVLKYVFCIISCLLQKGVWEFPYTSCFRQIWYKSVCGPVSSWKQQGNSTFLSVPEIPHLEIHSFGLKVVWLFYQ